MPIRPVEIMLGKIAPYVMVGAMQMTLILVAANLLFDVPIVGDLGLLVGLTMLFIVANLSVGYTFSTIATNQLQAMQMSFFFFFAEHPALRLHVPIPGNAGLGAIFLRDATADPLSAHRTWGHAEGRRIRGFADGRLRYGGIYGRRHGPCGRAVPADTGSARVRARLRWTLLPTT